MLLSVRKEKPTALKGKVTKNTQSKSIDGGLLEEIRELPERSTEEQLEDQEPQEVDGILSRLNLLVWTLVIMLELVLEAE
jgi:hypothetical protein